ncbi:hypothetical protein RBB50_011491 [Rhinocladiella similis]
MVEKHSDVDYDVVIVGAGISGISFGYRLQERNPHLKYCILDARHEIGGTWSLFQYPGIRSDSDLFTFGLPWRPWSEKQSIAQGGQIAKYLTESAEQEGILEKIKFNHQVNSMNWSTPSRLWTLNVLADKSTQLIFRTRFVLLGTGYYDYHEPLVAHIPGIENFKGTVVHPQFWPTNLDYANKNIVIIGSGATAITLLPAIATRASHVTMLQRSPSYILSVPTEDAFERTTRFLFPDTLAKKILRYKWMCFSFLLVSFCQWFPKLARSLFLKETAKQLPKEMRLFPDFTPKYNPWEQRLCVCPDGDFYECLKKGKASVTTGIIDTVTTNSIRLESGQDLYPDIIVTATGLTIAVGGRIQIYVDDTPYQIPDHFMWKGAMFEDLPNVVYALGYVDASWTLGADATSQLACRLLKQMEKEGVTMIVPRRSAEEKQRMNELPFFYLNSTYVERGKKSMPKTGDRGQWRRRSYYWKDLAMAWWGNIWTNLEWIK